MARESLQGIRSRLRRLIADTGTPSIWSDDELDEILDQNRIKLHALQLVAYPRHVNGVTRYSLYQSSHGELEELDESDDTVFRIYDASGISPIITADYAVDYITGLIKFTADQAAKTYYLDGYSYDLHGAAAYCWVEAMGSKAEMYNFAEDQQSFDRAQWFEHCQKMVQMHRNLKRQVSAQTLRA